MMTEGENGNENPRGVLNDWCHAKRVGAKTTEHKPRVVRSFCLHYLLAASDAFYRQVGNLFPS